MLTQTQQDYQQNYAAIMEDVAKRINSDLNDLACGTVTSGPLTRTSGGQCGSQPGIAVEWQIRLVSTGPRETIPVNIAEQSGYTP